MAGFTTAVAMTIAAAAGTGTSIYGMKKASKANKEAAKAEEKTIDREIELRREEQAKEEERFNREQDAMERRHQAEQENILAEREYDEGQDYADRAENRYRWESKDANLEPYRDVGFGALSALAGRSGLAAPAPRQHPGPPPELIAPVPRATAAPVVAPDASVFPGGGGAPRNSTQPVPTPTPTENVSRSSAMTPQAYARIATSPDALAAMTPDERTQLEQELAGIPMSALISRPRRNTAGRVT
jgi:hypothetical protein